MHRIIVTMNAKDIKRKSANPLISVKVQRGRQNHKFTYITARKHLNTNTPQVKPGARGESASPVFTQHPTKQLNSSMKRSNYQIVSMLLLMYICGEYS